MSVQPGLRGSNNHRVGRKMATFQLFFQSGRAKNLSAFLYIQPYGYICIAETCSCFYICDKSYVLTVILLFFMYVAEVGWAIKRG